MDEEQRKKRQLGGLKRWAGTDSVTRSQIMSDKAKGKWAGKTKEERSEHAKKMALARWKRYQQGK